MQRGRAVVEGDQHRARGFPFQEASPRNSDLHTHLVNYGRTRKRAVEPGGRQKAESLTAKERVLDERKRTILVTGGAGFFGGNFVLDLVRAGGHKVVNLDALTYAGNLDTLAPILEDPNHVFVRGSIGDRPLVDRLLAEHRPYAIINLAAETHVDRSIDGPKAFVRTNVVETLELLEAALAYWGGLVGVEREGFRFLHVSTDEVYGTL